MIDIKENNSKNFAELQKALNIKNRSALPKITKVTLNSSLGPLRHNKDAVEFVRASLQVIAGQKPAIRRAKKAIAGFKLRTGEEIGLVVTLRGQRMYDFLNRLINITLPRIRDFKGINVKAFDHQGNLSIGFKDHIPFAELGHQAIDKQFGLSVTLTIINSNPVHSAKLLQLLGFPLKAE